jgi:hypothetical protein
VIQCDGRKSATAALGGGGRSSEDGDDSESREDGGNSEGVAVLADPHSRVTELCGG